MNLLDFSLSVGTHPILKHYDVTGTPRGGIRFSGHYQTEGLQIRTHVQVGLVGGARQNLGDIPYATFRSHRPKRVRQVFASESLGWKHVFEGSVDLRTAPLRFHRRLSFGFRHEHGAPKIDLG